MKKALITGITGQDGYYLTKFLLKKNYQVHGIKRRTSLINTKRIDEFFENKQLHDKKFILHHGDMTDASSLTSILNKVKPNEIYNLAAQSHVKVSFEIPEYTANSDAIGVLRLLEAVRSANLEKKIKIYHASTSELYGKSKSQTQNEDTPFYPRSPYGVAKLYAHWIIINYREAYNIHACNGINFYIPNFPAFPLKLNLNIYLNEKPWSVVRPMWLFLFPSVIGFTYLVRLDVSLSIWFFSFLSITISHR